MPMTFYSQGGNGAGAVPFQRIVEPSQLSMYLNLEQSELLRINGYNERWRFYFGKHWTFKRESGEPLVTLNYFRKIIDKAVEFLVSKGFTINTPAALEYVTKPFLDEVWEYNKRQSIVWDYGTTGGVTGDVFTLISYEQPTPFQQKINPFSQGRIRINLLGSEQVFPTWDPLNIDTLLAVRIETIYHADKNDAAPIGTTDEIVTANNNRQLMTKRFTQIITPQYIMKQFHGEPPTIEYNALGEIPLVHISNVSVPREYYGLSDGQDIVDVQREINEKCTDVSDIINYHCVDTATEALTKQGWKKYDELKKGDLVLSLNAETDEITWEPVRAVNVYKDVDGLVEWDSRGVSAVTTPKHRWLVERATGRPANLRYERMIARTLVSEDGDPAVSELRGGSRIILGGGSATHFPETEVFDLEEVETVGWLVTEGSVVNLPSGSQTIILAQSETANPAYVEDIRALQRYWTKKGHTFTEQRVRNGGVVCWYLGVELTRHLLEIVPNKSLPPSFLTLLTQEQAERLYEVLISADGTRSGGREYWYQDDLDRVAGFQMLAAMICGARTNFSTNCRGHGVTYVHKTRTIEALSAVKNAKAAGRGTVWCPTVDTGTWFARRSGYTYWTGNSSPITAVFGAKAKQLDRGPRNIWTGLPEKARIETVNLPGDLTASKNYIELIKKVLHELSDTPEGALGAMQPISNTSGVALHMQYQPLIGKTDRKRSTYEPGFEQINYFILRTAMVAGLIRLPFDLCRNCGGRIVETATGKMERYWDPGLGAFADRPAFKKKCYTVDPQTLEFEDPMEMRLKFWRQYGFGMELRDMSLRQIIDEIKREGRSFWDYTVLQEGLLEKWRKENEDAIWDATPDDPKPTKVPAGEKVIPPPEKDPNAPPDPTTPQVNVAPPKIEPPPTLRIQPIPELDIPEEPEMVDLEEKYVHPVTGEVVDIVIRHMELVPTGCRRPMYLNPFENEVFFNDVLPKDEAMQAELFGMYLDRGLVDIEWCQERIPEIAESVNDIRRRAKKRGATNAAVAPAAGQGDPNEWKPESGPLARTMTSVPGPDGNATPMTQQLQTEIT